MKSLPMVFEHQEVIDGEKKFGLYSETNDFDLTHPPTPTSLSIHPRITLGTVKSQGAIGPTKTALVLVDL